MNSYARNCLALVGLFALLAGCKDMGIEPAPAPTPPSVSGVSFQQNVLPIFARYGCTGCHGGSGGLTVGTVADLLRGGTHGPAVIAGDDANSIIVKKLGVTPPFGSRMPQGGPFLPDSTVQVIRDWIKQGAKNN